MNLQLKHSLSLNFETQLVVLGDEVKRNQFLDVYFRGILDNAEVSVKRINSGRYRRTDYELEVNDFSMLSHPILSKNYGYLC
ncbi:hypothetical protein PHJA_002910200 [Phtheirospermum japonicum]|uniref:Uncharacterized protein n=1 Tax=Phtheirospermum japonicum TaxID=374723 RepID=A0A830D6C1_9LAMI|nr:hypothetical protein PHJA_002910200 [Phtheirospermum japonicum]